MAASNMEQNIDIVLNYFKPIPLPPNPVTDDSTYESNSDDVFINEPTVAVVAESDTVDGEIQNDAVLSTGQLKATENDEQVASAMDKLDLKDSLTDNDDNSSEIDTNEDDFHSFVEKYGIEGVTNIFNSIEQYPAEHMIKLLHSFEIQLEKLTDETYKRLLQLEMEKLQNQITQRETHYKKHLIDVLLESPDSSDKVVQKAMLREFLSLDNLVDIVLATEDYLELTEKKKQMEILLGEMKLSQSNQYNAVCQKIMREIIWDYAEKFLSRIEPSGAKCTICKVLPKEYVIEDCGHYCLCDFCKRRIECIQPKCPICRIPITKFLKVFE